MQNSFANADWSDLMNAVTELPPTWQPRREQPEWDRAFTGRADMQVQFSARTDTARQWLVEALTFSEILKAGFRSEECTDDSGLRSFGAMMRHHIAKGKQQFDA